MSLVKRSVLAGRYPPDLCDQNRDTVVTVQKCAKICGGGFSLLFYWVVGFPKPNCEMLNFSFFS